VHKIPEELSFKKKNPEEPEDLFLAAAARCELDDGKM
jgi:organic hydroperoxide reductase OsmC/OhrA